MWQALSVDVTAHEVDVDALRKMCVMVDSTSATSLSSASASRYATLLAAVDAKRLSLESSFSSHEQFIDAYRHCMESLYSEQQRLKKLSSSNTDETDQRQLSLLNVSINKEYRITQSRYFVSCEECKIKTEKVWFCKCYHFERNQDLLLFFY